MSLETTRKYTIRELQLEDADLMMNVTMGLIISGTYLDVLRLKKQVGDQVDFKIVYNTISTSHLRVVKVDEFNEYLEWRKHRDD